MLFRSLIIRRQRPLAKAVFITLEDELGHIPLMVWPKTYARLRNVLRAPFVIVQGAVSRRDGTMNIIVTGAEVLQVLDTPPPSRDFR